MHLIKYCKKIFIPGRIKNPAIITWQRGQASLEFAMVAPFLFLIIFAVIQAGHLVYLQNLVEHAAHESARIIATTGSDNAGQKCVSEILENKGGSRVETNIIPGQGSGRDTGSIVRVQVNYHYDGVAKVIKILTGQSMHINSAAAMRMECADE